MDKFLTVRDEGMGTTVWEKIEHTRTHRLESRLSRMKAVKDEVIGTHRRVVTDGIYKVRINKIWGGVWS